MARPTVFVAVLATILCSFASPGLGAAPGSIEDAGSAQPLSAKTALKSLVTTLSASDIASGDWFGYSVAISGDTAVVGAIMEDGGAGDPLNGAGAAYIFERNQGGPDAWGEVTILHASDAQANDHFGSSVAISGDIVVVGADGEDGGAGDPAANAGAAYVFDRNEGGTDAWGEVAILRASDAQSNDSFGYSVAVSGITAVVGAYQEGGGAGDPVWGSGAAYVFDRDQGGVDAWGEVAILHASDAQVADYFGESVAISGDTAVVGARDEDGGAGNPAPDAGAAYVYKRDQGGIDAWGEVTILRASDSQAGDHFGYSAAIDGDTVAIGAYDEDGGAGDPITDAGAAYIFERNQGGPEAWGEVAILRASDAQSGDELGISIAMDGDLVVVGSVAEDGGPGDPVTSAGAAYVFYRNQGGVDAWGETTALRAPDSDDNDFLGISAGISGLKVVAGAYAADGGPGMLNVGAAYLFSLGPDLIFADGFESGDTTAWSSTVP